MKAQLGTTKWPIKETPAAIAKNPYAEAYAEGTTAIAATKTADKIAPTVKADFDTTRTLTKEAGADILEKPHGDVEAGTALLAEKSTQNISLSDAVTTAELNRASLINELRANGIKFTEDKIVAIGRSVDTQVVFLETGTTDAGLLHIMAKHAQNFTSAGIPESQIAEIVMKAALEANITGSQGTNRFIYRTTFNGKTYNLAITISKNGYIVGANPTGKGF